ncbi:hypothetical protein HK105_202160 [Polyrhizophydium stewartii]|uniref:RING-type domain-containing protein n=1 Tax=Polyrhizophydium stewartii TaxID=2732419 RepID=A0ABR4NFD3_9FUNG
MPRHSKNNTALPFFTSAERSKLDYGTQRQRLGRDSMRDFDACMLCLRAAVHPVCCTQGHLYCKECILNSILSQKKQIQRDLQAAQAFDSSAKASDAAKSELEKARKIEEFKKSETDPLAHVAAAGSSSGSKSDAPSGPVLPTPTAPKVEKQEPQCTAAVNPHPVSIKKLVSVVFSTPPASKSAEAASGQDLDVQGVKHCPSCLTTLRNGIKIVVLRGCGHAFCRTCCGKFVKTSQKCMLCDAKCRDKDIITLDVEGTGFSSAGKAVATKSGPAFN